MLIDELKAACDTIGKRYRNPIKRIFFSDWLKTQLDKIIVTVFDGSPFGDMMSIPFWVYKTSDDLLKLLKEHGDEGTMIAVSKADHRFVQAVINEQAGFGSRATVAIIPYLLHKEQ